MVGRSRIERCSNCGVQLLLPPLTWKVRCAVCHVTTNFRQLDSLSPSRETRPVARLHGPNRTVASWVKSITSPASSSSSTGFNPFRRAEPAAVGSGWPATYPQPYGKKRAVVCGVSYTGRPYELKGTVNDVNCIKFFLCERFQFPSDCILVLTEEERDSSRIPTKENMRSAMRWLVHGVQPGDSLVFHFSGHGSQKVDESGIEELDGFDETLCPLDYEANGMILDDEINETIVRPIPRGAKLHALIDSCHSGTMLDLPFVCRINRSKFYQWEDHSPPSGKYTGTSGGLAICISGCDDHQTSADTTALTGSSTTTGAMTFSFINALEKEPGTTYGQMLMNMRSLIRGADTGIRMAGPIASLLKRVFSCGLTQVPQLSSSEIFDIYRKPFLL